MSWPRSAGEMQCGKMSGAEKEGSRQRRNPVWPQDGKTEVTRTPLGLPLGEQAACEHEQACLGRRRDAPAWPSVGGAGAADVDDEAAALRLHDRRRTAAAEHRTVRLLARLRRMASSDCSVAGPIFTPSPASLTKTSRRPRLRQHLGHQPVPGITIRNVGSEGIAPMASAAACSSSSLRPVIQTRASAFTNASAMPAP